MPWREGVLNATPAPESGFRPRGRQPRTCPLMFQAYQLLLATSALHDLGWLLRDIKPGNVLVSDDDRLEHWLARRYSHRAQPQRLKLADCRACWPSPAVADMACNLERFDGGSFLLEGTAGAWWLGGTARV